MPSKSIQAPQNAKWILSVFKILLFLTPLIWLPFSSELFEIPKMYFVWITTSLIAGLWLARMILEKKIIFRKTPLDIPIFLFLASQAASAWFSIDKHISFWGYYNRMNGGLLSITAYIVLYYALVSNLNLSHWNLFEIWNLRFGIDAVVLIPAFIVSIDAILEHFGFSLSCLWVNGSLGVDCWVQDIQTRVFATLGQPNWLGAYLAALLPVATAAALNVKRQNLNVKQMSLNWILGLVIWVSPLALYTALLFTGSRSGFLGFWIANIVFSALSALYLKLFHLPGGTRLKQGLKRLFLINLIFLALTFVIGSPFRSLHNEASDTADIRWLVWQGAIKAFEKRPVWGWGPETFAWVYYNVRPTGHNLTSEWNFLYNKTHNEYLNYLATTGALGLGSYLLIIAAFIVWFLKNVNYQMPNVKSNPKLKAQKGELSGFWNLTSAALFAGWVSLLATNFFGFSTVTANLFFFLLPALIFILNSPIYAHSSSDRFLFKPAMARFFRRLKEPARLTGLIGLTTLIVLIILVKFFLADLAFARALAFKNAKDYTGAYQNIRQAISLRPSEPVYRSEASEILADLAILADENSKELAEAAIAESEKALETSPQNMNFLKAKMRMFYTLSLLDEDYLGQALATADKTVELAPTDALLRFNQAVLYEAAGKTQEAVGMLEKTLELKPDYKEARTELTKLSARE